MNVISFVKKYGKEIILVFSGSLLPLLTLFISNHLEFGIKKYENHAVYNRLIFEQGLRPYRNKQIQYQHKNFELFDEMVEAIKFWLGLKKITVIPQKSLTKSEQDLAVSLYKKGEDFRFQINILDKQLDYYCNEAINNAEEIAMLLNIESKYRNIYQQFRMDEKKLYKEHATKIKSSLAKINLSYPKNPTTTNLLQFLDASNNYKISQEKNSIKSEQQRALTVEILEINYEFSAKLFQLHLQFYAETNRLFFKTYRKHVDS